MLILLSSCLMASMISSFTLCNSRTTSSKISCFILSKSKASVSLPLPTGRTLDTSDDLSAELARSHGFFAPSEAFCPLDMGEGEFGSSFWLSPSFLSSDWFAAFRLRASRAFISSIRPPLPPLVRLASFLAADAELSSGLCTRRSLAPAIMAARPVGAFASSWCSPWTP